MAQASGSPGSRGGMAAEQRREQLLRAALDVIVARGYAETRIADVAEHAGTSPALVIYYFKTRDQLLTEALHYSEDTSYAAGTERLSAISTAAGRLLELIAMTCLPGTDAGMAQSDDGRSHAYVQGDGERYRTQWLLWLDLWAFSLRNSGVSAVRQKFALRWRETIETTVLGGQEAGEFSASVDAGEFAVTLSALLDGMAVQIALEDPHVTPARAYELAVRFAAGQLGFSWQSTQQQRSQIRS
jgi:AcrR family transcriptional regulator